MTEQTEHIDLENAELQRAMELILHTNRSLFLTGKAGSGKSTFLRHICKTTKKKHVVLAPTGIAAINAGGVTLHSFFKIPFHPLVPNDVKYSPRHIKETLKYNGEKCKIIRELELIIIDEISMVRADIIDFVDKVLRIYSRNMREPFGGKQLLLVGDIYQLEPVVKEDERHLLTPFYPSAYFFDALVFRQFQLVSIELKKVYRQNDPSFIRMLDNIRINRVTDQELLALNRRVGAQLSSADHRLAITLSARRDTVDFINEGHLRELPGAPVRLSGEIIGEFPSQNLPTAIELDIKPGAQIIFVKNDKEHRWVNGTLGVVMGLGESDGGVSQLYIVTEDGQEYDVERECWSNMRYTFNAKEQKIEEEEIGTFTQFPIRLAWAITVHKSQGLTFRQVNIDFSGGVFAGGQTYVALSRCTSLEGISLKSPIRRSDIFVRSEVLRFASTYNNQQVYQRALSESQADREYREAVSAFDAGDMESFLDYFFKAIHHRYDIEHPVVRRYLRRKLNIINTLRQEKDALIAEQKSKERYLKKLSVEYVMLGKECEHEGMTDAAIANYRKAVELYPTLDIKRRIKELEKKRKP